VSRRRRTITIFGIAAAALVLPASAWAHAALLRTVPSASRIVNTSPAQVLLTYSEAVEPRFAIVSVTDAAGAQQTAAPPRRSPADPDTLVVPLKRLSQGWYLVYWRVISVDGHPVRGAFTYAVGPNAGPAPQFVIPSIAETAATPPLIVARWLVFLSVMGAIGVFVLSQLTARPLVSRVSGTRLRALSIAFVVAAAVALVATPVYVLLATAKFALRSAWDVGALVPLVRVSAFGRGYVDLELCFALFTLAAAVSLWVGRPERPRRSVAELLALAGALAGAAAALLVATVSGHAGQTSPRGVAILLDWLHLAAGSLWVGGLAGLLILAASLPAARRVAGLVVFVPRFSNVALGSVFVLVASGIGASVLHLPTLGSLWQTSYGQALLAKIALLLLAILLASNNLLRTVPRLRASRDRPALGAPAAVLLRRLVTGETLLVAAAVLAAALLSSLAPPASALAKAGGAAAHVGPGPVNSVVNSNGYRLELHVNPNRAAVPNAFTVRITRDGVPLRGATVTTTFNMLDMEMGQQAYHMTETQPGLYERTDTPAFVMVGHWALDVGVEPLRATPFHVLFVDRAAG
jgi:copper transport protein